LGDVHTGVAGADDEHVAAVVGARRAEGAGVDELAREAVGAGPVRHARRRVVSGGDDEVPGAQRARIRVQLPAPWASLDPLDVHAEADGWRAAPRVDLEV